MATISQATYTRLFERYGSVLSGLRRFFDAANLISNSYFIFRQRDEFRFFPDAPTQFGRVTNLLRGVAYSADDSVLRIEITEITAGVSYSLEIKDVFGGTTIASAAGIYGALTTLVSDAANGPEGQIIVEAPTGAPAAPQEVELLVVPSSVRLISDVLGETEAEKLIEAESAISNRITAENLRNSLLKFSRDRIVVSRTVRNLIGVEFLGSDTQDPAKFVQQPQGDGAVLAFVSGILAELDTAMKTNVPVQTVEQITPTLGSSGFDFPAGGTAGAVTVTRSNPTAGKLRAKCVRGLVGTNPDSEEFEVEFISTTLGRKIVGGQRLRPFRAYEFPQAGYTLTIDRATTDTDPFGRVNNVKITQATLTNIPTLRLLVETFVDPDSPAILGSFFRILDEKTLQIIYEKTSQAGTSPFPDGPVNLFLANGLNVSFDWQANPTTSETVEFEIRIHPYRVGDVFFDEIDSISGGRINVESRRHFDFAFRQSGGSPTIPNSIVAPDLPFIKPILGA